MNIQDKRNELTSLIDNIKEHSDQVKNFETLPLLELSVVLAKITKLHECALILKYLTAKKQNYLEEEFGISEALINQSPFDPSKVEKPQESENELNEIDEQTFIDESKAETNNHAMDYMVESTLENSDRDQNKETKSDEVSPDNSEVSTNLPQSTDNVKSTSKDESDKQVAPEPNPKAEAIDALLKEGKSAITVEKTSKFISDMELKAEISAKPDVNEAFTKTDDPSLGNHLQKAAITDLISSIGLNERYLYANDLFDGDMEEFRNAIGVLNEQDSRESAKSYFNNNLINTYNWKKNHPLVKALENLIDRRFQN